MMTERLIDGFAIWHEVPEKGGTCRTAMSANEDKHMMCVMAEYYARRHVEELREVLRSRRTALQQRGFPVRGLPVFRRLDGQDVWVVIEGESMCDRFAVEPCQMNGHGQLVIDGKIL